jgi:hypothetical protein
MKSVRSYYRSRGARFFRNIYGSDDWKSAIELVRDIETKLQVELGQYYQERTKTSLDDLVRRADERTALLGDITQDIRGFIAQQKDIVRKKDESDCLRDLRVVDPGDDMKRIESNKDELLDDAYKWIFNTDEYRSFINWENDAFGYPQRQLLWIKGHAGTGKTMLMIGLIRHFSNLSATLAPGLSFFFCQGANAKLTKATAILRSLIWLLILQQPCLMSHLLQKYTNAGASFFDDDNSFFALSDVFKHMLGDPKLFPVYLAVDALDECWEDREKFITLISATLTLSPKVKWLLFSRPEVDILAGLGDPVTLIELDTQHLRVPVKAYIEHKLGILKGKKGYNDEILEDISKEVHKRAGNTFLWVALAFRALERKHGMYAVELILQIPFGLSDLYQHMMTKIEKGETIESKDCKKVLKAAFLAFRPLCLFELSLVTGLLPNFAKDVVTECGSFVTLTGETVNLIHQSAKDFLKDKYTTMLDPTGVVQGHMEVVERFLTAIASLPWNIYNLDYGPRPDNMTSPNPDPLVPLHYSCVYWVDHLCSIDNEDFGLQKAPMAGVLKFLRTGFLRWLESLSLLDRVEDGVLSMRKLVHFVRVCLQRHDAIRLLNAASAKSTWTLVLLNC